MTTRASTLLAAALAATLSTACSVRQFAVGALADALAEGGNAFASDDDPELVRDAMPFALKAMEALLAETPNDPGLLAATAAAFTQYAYAFVELDAEAIEEEDYLGSLELRERAFRLYSRARDYGVRALEANHEGIASRLRVDPPAAAAELGPDELEACYWTAASWGSAVSLALDQPELAADLDVARALMRRALELDEDFDGGAIHEAMIAIEGLPEAMGGSEERAREHFDRALELSGGLSAGPYVTLATSVSLGSQDRAEFEALLGHALAIDPDEEPEMRLANLLAQRRARLLLKRADDLFLEPLD